MISTDYTPYFTIFLCLDQYEDDYDDEYDDEEEYLLFNYANAVVAKGLPPHYRLELSALDTPSGESSTFASVTFRGAKDYDQLVQEVSIYSMRALYSKYWVLK